MDNIMPTVKAKIWYSGKRTDTGRLLTVRNLAS